MKLVYLTKNLNSYIYRDVSYPSSIPIGSCNKYGHILVYVIYYHNNKVHILNSWEDYYTLSNLYNKIPLYARLHYFLKGVKINFAYKLIRLAYKINK